MCKCVIVGVVTRPCRCITSASTRTPRPSDPGSGLPGQTLAKFPWRLDRRRMQVTGEPVLGRQPFAVMLASSRESAASHASKAGAPHRSCGRPCRAAARALGEGTLPPGAASPCRAGDGSPRTGSRAQGRGHGQNVAAAADDVRRNGRLVVLFSSPLTTTLPCRVASETARGSRYRAKPTYMPPTAIATRGSGAMRAAIAIPRAARLRSNLRNRNAPATAFAYMYARCGG
jgi:hypothetical protein